MSCANCAARIEKGVGAQTGVLSATVNFAMEEITVSHDDSVISVEEIVDYIKKLGYGATPPEPPGELTFAVRGLHCAILRQHAGKKTA